MIEELLALLIQADEMQVVEPVPTPIVQDIDPELFKMIDDLINNLE